MSKSPDGFELLIPVLEQAKIMCVAKVFNFETFFRNVTSKGFNTEKS
jgi:hypothetical protein